MNPNNYKFRQEGFTLIELLVVIAIVGMLATIVMTSLSTVRIKARDARRMADIRQINTAIELYTNENGHAPYVGSYNCTVENAGDESCNQVSETSRQWTELQTELTPYMATLPIDPCGQACAGGGSTFAYKYIPPSVLKSICNSAGCNLSNSDLRNMHAVLAQNMEIDSSAYTLTFDEKPTFGFSGFGTNFYTGYKY